MNKIICSLCVCIAIAAPLALEAGDGRHGWRGGNHHGWRGNNYHPHGGNHYYGNRPNDYYGYRKPCPSRYYGSSVHYYSPSPYYRPVVREYYAPQPYYSNTRFNFSFR